MRGWGEQWEEIVAKPADGGIYELKDLQPGAWELSASCPGFLSRRVQLHLEPNETKHDEDVLLEPAIVVAVRVQADLPKEVALTEGVGRLLLSGVGSFLASTIAARDENKDVRLLYKLGYASPPSLDVYVIPTLEEPGSVLDSSLAASSDIGRFRTRESRPAPFGVRRSSGGRARSLALDADVTDALESQHRDRPDPKLLADGRSLDDLSSEDRGVLELSETPPLFASLVVRSCVLDSVPVLRGANEITLHLKRQDVERLIGAIHLVVVDAETGVAIPNARVELEPSVDPAEHWTDKSGTLVMKALVPGPATLRIRSTDRETVEDRIFVALGGTTELGVYRLNRTSRGQVEVRDAEGHPHEVAFNVLPEEAELATRELLATRLFRSDAEGVLKLRSLACGRHVILTRDEEWACMPALLDTTLRDARDFGILVAKPTDVALRLRAQPPPNARLCVRTQAGLPVTDRRCRSCDPMHFALAPGSYTVEFFDGDLWLWSEGVAVGAEPVRRWLPR